MPEQRRGCHDSIAGHPNSTTADIESNTERLFHSIHFIRFVQNVEQGRKSGIRSIKSSLFYKKGCLPSRLPASIQPATLFLPRMRKFQVRQGMLKVKRYEMMLMSCRSTMMMGR